jgi:lysophospholipid acyltransferase (LPLAT)-like uncharacterized protein
VLSRVRTVLGIVLGALVGVWVRTLRVSVEVHPGSLAVAERRVLAFFHGQQMALLGARRFGRTAVLVSRSADGEIQTGVMTWLGLSVVRGSSSRGGAAGLRAIVRKLASGEDAAFAVDGPRGPVGIPKTGALVAARAARAALLPVASACRAGWVLGRAWDRFEIPLPFSRVAVVVGAPVPGPHADAETLGAAIHAARERALALL